MRNPRGLPFKVANFSIEDELGRNFSFVEQDVNDRTAFLEIDYAGNRATSSGFDDTGKPTGITLQQAAAVPVPAAAPAVRGWHDRTSADLPAGKSPAGVCDGAGGRPGKCE